MKEGVIAALVILLCGCAAPLTINQIQFVGSHNSYKQAMSRPDMQALRAANPAAADALDYSHVPLAEQLDLGMRKLELDVFNASDRGEFPVGHLQVIDMNSHCAELRLCLAQIKAWSDANPRHVPLWISFNLKDAQVTGLPDPVPFDEDALRRLDDLLEAELGGRLIRPADVDGLAWPRLRDARGKLLLILDERGTKRDLYWQGWRERPMFTNAPEGHAAAAVMIINDPLAQQDEIERLVMQGYMVRTRADADTREARDGGTQRREAAFASGAQAVSTDYYLPALRFRTGYQVRLDPPVRCNPVSAPRACAVGE